MIEDFLILVNEYNYIPVRSQPFSCFYLLILSSLFPIKDICNRHSLLGRQYRSLLNYL